MSREFSTKLRPPPIVPAGAPRVRLAASAEGEFAQFETSEPVTLIGSRRDCDLFIPKSDVSKTHCALVNTGTAIVVADLCSRTGTFINEQCVSARTLRPGDKLRVGSVPIEVEFLDPPTGSESNAHVAGDSNTVLASPLRLAHATQQYELMTLPAVIGRRNASQIMLDTPDVSLAHTLLFVIEGRPVLFDLGSRSGTFLNGVRVTLAWLQHGDRLSIGGEELALAWEGPQFADCASYNERWAELEAAALGDAEATLNPEHSTELGDLDIGSEGLKAQTGESPADVREVAEAPQEHEIELGTGSAALQGERARLAARERQLGRRLADFEAAIAALEAREQALKEREAALAEGRKNQPGLAERDDGNDEGGPGGQELTEPVGRPPSRAARGDTTTPAPAGKASTAPAGAARDDELPAPLVDKPLFDARSAYSPDQWPRELLERLDALRNMGQTSDTNVIARILRQYQQSRQRGEERRPTGD